MKTDVPTKHWSWLVAFMLIFIWSGVAPAERFTWLLEVLPAVIGLVLVVVSYRRFPLTDLLLFLLLIHATVLMVGGRYTYAEVPLFDWLRDILGQSRNNYDKVGHFFQGFVPAILAREILLRNKVVKRGAWLNLFVISVVLSVSAFYELIEWWVAIASGEGATAFLGTQGYEWDTQSDMLFALIGGLCGLLLLSSLHDRQLQQMPE